MRQDHRDRIAMEQQQRADLGNVEHGHAQLRAADENRRGHFHRHARRPAAVAVRAVSQKDGRSLRIAAHGEHDAVAARLGLAGGDARDGREPVDLGRLDRDLAAMFCAVAGAFYRQVDFAPLRLQRSSNRANHRIDTADQVGGARHCRRILMHGALQVRNFGFHLAGREARLGGKRLHAVRDFAETLALFAKSRGLDTGVQRKDFGLTRDLGDDADDGVDPSRGLPQALHAGRCPVDELLRFADEDVDAVRVAPDRLGSGLEPPRGILEFRRYIRGGAGEARQRVARQSDAFEMLETLVDLRLRESASRPIMRIVNRTSSSICRMSPSSLGGAASMRSGGRRVGPVAAGDSEGGAALNRQARDKRAPCARRFKHNTSGNNRIRLMSSRLIAARASPNAALLCMQTETRGEAMTKAVVGVIGGSGVYALDGLQLTREERIASPWGEPSDALRFGKLGRTELRLPRPARPGPSPLAVDDQLSRQYRRAQARGRYRHRRDFRLRIVPARILSRHVRAGRPDPRPDFCPPDQLLRDGLRRACPDGAPISPRLRRRIADAARAPKTSSAIPAAPTSAWRGRNSPRLPNPCSTRRSGADVIGMTVATEAKLAREAEISYADDRDGHRLRLLARGTRARSTSPRRQSGAGETPRAPTRLVVARPPHLPAEHEPCPAGSDRALDGAIMTPPEARDPELMPSSTRSPAGCCARGCEAARMQLHFRANSFISISIIEI